MRPYLVPFLQPCPLLSVIYVGAKSTVIVVFLPCILDKNRLANGCSVGITKCGVDFIFRVVFRKGRSLGDDMPALFN